MPQPPLSTTPRPCGAANDHGLRPGTEFVLEGRTYVPAYERDGHWFTWKDEPMDGGTAYHSRPATAATLISGRPAIARTAVPASEAEALITPWMQVVVYDIDAAAGTFTSDRGTFSIEAARIPSDPRAVE